MKNNFYLPTHISKYNIKYRIYKNLQVESTE